MEDQDKRKYPIGQCPFQDQYTAAQRRQFLNDLETFPARLENLVQHLNEYQLGYTYRDGSWTIQQIIHHCADSHMNALIRIKLALTEENPGILPYKEALWAEMADYQLPFNLAITLLFALHRKLHAVLDSLKEEQWERTYFHPQYQRQFRIEDVLCLYAWHGRHHLAHIELALQDPQNQTL